jgi:MFS transporter, DHA1 family, inner membrane transport protein
MSPAPANPPAHASHDWISCTCIEIAPGPPLAPASVALNISVLYIGQAIGSFVGGIFYARDWLHEQGFVGAAFVAVALALVITSRPEPGSAS